MITKNNSYYVIASASPHYSPGVQEDIFQDLLDVARSFLPFQIETEKPAFEIWFIRCEFNSYEKAYSLYEYWKKQQLSSKVNTVDIWVWIGSIFCSIWSDPQKRILAMLHEKLGGSREVTTPLGRIDLLTGTDIIEVKPFKEWKAALGQIIVYSKFYPQHQKRLYLFDRKFPNKLEIIRSACIDYSIVVDFELDEGYRHEK